MTVRVGALGVDLSAESASFERDMGKARASLGSASAAMNRSLAGLEKGFGQASRGLVAMGSQLFNVKGLLAGLGVGLGAGAFVAATREALSFADTIGKVADKVGVSTAELQELRYAAQLAGVGTQTLDMALQRFSRRVGEVAQGTGELKATAEQYGVAVRDQAGRMRSNVDILNDFADVIARTSSEQERLRIAFKLFDSEGAALVTLLRQGSAGLEAMRAEANRLGLVLDENMIRTAEKANDQLEIMGQALKVNLAKALIQVSPLILQLGASFKEAAPKIAAFFDSLGYDSLRSVQSLREEMRRLEGEITTLTGMDSFADVRENLPAFDSWRALGIDDETKRRIREKLERLRELDDQLKQRAAAEAAVAVAMDDGAMAGEQQARAIDALATELQEEIALLGMSAGEQELYTRAKKAGLEVNEQLRAAIAPLIAQLQAEQAAQKATEQAAKDHAQALKEVENRARAVFEETRTPLEQYQAKLAELNDLVERGAIDWDTYQRAVADAQKRLETTTAKASGLTDAARDLGLSFQSAFEDAIVAGKGLSEVLRGLAQDMLRLITRKLVTEPLANAATSALAGFLPGFANGGAFTVGGAGGTDSQLVAFRATPGERVTISNDDAAGGGGTTIVADLRGADVAAVQRLERMVHRLNAQLETRAISAQKDLRDRQPNAFRGNT